MKKPVTHSARRVVKIQTAQQNLSAPIAWSSLGHLVFILLFIFLPRFTPEASAPSHIINVQLVPSNAQVQVPTPAVEQTAAPAAEPASSPKAEVSTAPKPKDEVSLAPEVIEKKQSMKKKTYKRENILESAIKNVEKRVEASKVDPKQQALDKIRSELNDRDAGAAVEDTVGAAGTAAMSGGGTPSTDIEMFYSVDVAIKIQQNWAFSDQLAGGEKNLYNLVAITVLRSGWIEDIDFERKSGNRYFDDSTYKAIQKSNPLPRIPDGIKRTSITLRFRFIPEGLK